MTIVINNLMIPSILHSLKDSLKNYKLFLSFFSNYIDSDDNGYEIIKDEEYKYSRLLGNQSYNQINMYFDFSDSIEILYESDSSDFDIQRVESPTTYYYKILDNTKMFYDEYNTETRYYLYLKKIVNWSMIPYEYIHSDSLTFSLIYLCYTPNLIVDSISLPRSGSILNIQSLDESRTISLNSSISDVYEFFIELTGV